MSHQKIKIASPSRSNAEGVEVVKVKVTMDEFTEKFVRDVGTNIKESVKADISILKRHKIIS